MTQQAVIDHCFSQIMLQSKRPLMVGVCGDSGSGKSFFATLLKERIESSGVTCEVVNHDDFLISRKDREPMKSVYYNEGPYTGKSHWEILENMFRLDEFSRVINQFGVGECAEYHAYSRESGVVESRMTKACPADITLFDTSMLLDKLDFLILIDVTQENIIARKIERDQDIRSAEEVEEMHRKVQGAFWLRAKPTTVDITIDNNDFTQPKIV